MPYGRRLPVDVWGGCACGERQPNQEEDEYEA